MIGFLFLALMAVINVFAAIRDKNEQEYGFCIVQAFLAGAFAMLAVVHAVNTWKVAS